MAASLGFERAAVDTRGAEGGKASRRFFGRFASLPTQSAQAPESDGSSHPTARRPAGIVSGRLDGCPAAV